VNQEELKELLHYNPGTGIFTWLVNRTGGVKAGDVPCYKSDGYIQISVNNKDYKAHRLAFFYMTGDWPKEQIDHKNHVRDDNRWVNLREATHQENQKNRTISKNNTSGVMGVCWNKKRKKWESNIWINGKQKHLGRFNDKFEAACSRKSAENKHSFHPNHGRI